MFVSWFDSTGLCMYDLPFWSPCFVHAEKDSGHPLTGPRRASPSERGLAPRLTRKRTKGFTYVHLLRLPLSYHNLARKWVAAKNELSYRQIGDGG